MFRPRHPAAERRRAVILMVVLALLTLFAIVGVSFVLYANAEADSSRLFREAVSLAELRPGAAESPETLLNFALGQLVFPVPDEPTGTAPNLQPPQLLASALRGHDLARNMYGWNSTNKGYGTNNVHPWGNTIPFNGTGRLRGTPAAVMPLMLATSGLDDSYYINYGWFKNDNFVRDPERIGYRNTPLEPVTAYAGGWNPPYTYFDLNHMAFAAVDSNLVLMTNTGPTGPYAVAPSFHRAFGGPETANPGDTNYFGSLAPTNPNWYDTTRPWLKYMVLRPRPADMGPGFPAPRDAGGDVKNLPGPGGMDSIWLDLDYPVRIGPTGTKYKPLFAFLIMPLDGKINVNAAGNARGVIPAGGGNFSLSGQGWGRWEINPSRLNPDPAQAAEWLNLLLDPGRGRYGPDREPSSSGTAAESGKSPHVYGQVNYEGSDDTNPPSNIGGNRVGVIILPAPLPSPAPPDIPFPFFPPGYNNGAPYERTNHPLRYNVTGPSGDDRVLPLADMVKLLHPRTPADVLSSTIGQLMPNNVSTARVRHMITTDSWDVGRPSLTPWLYNPNDPTNVYGYGAAPLQTDPTLPPMGGPVPFPPLTTRLDPAGTVPGNSDFATPGQPNYVANPAPPPANFPNPVVDWRGVRMMDWAGIRAILQKVDLNQFLPPYPHMGFGVNSRPFAPPPGNVGGYSSLPMLRGPHLRYDDDNAYIPSGTPGAPPGAIDWTGPISPTEPYGLGQKQFILAHNIRQRMTFDIYRRLLAATGVPDVDPARLAAPLPAELAPRRYLAQLAVNIVDFIDEDEISTPFNFYTVSDANNDPAFQVQAVENIPGNPNAAEMYKYWVFGTEMPRLVINEVLVEHEPYTPPATGTIPVNVKVSVELLNPLPPAAPTTTYEGEPPPAGSTAGLPYRADAVLATTPGTLPTGNTPPYAVYQLVVGDNVVFADPVANRAAGGLLSTINPADLANTLPYSNGNVLGTPNQVRSPAPSDPDFIQFTASNGGANDGNFKIGPQQAVVVTAPGRDFNTTINPEEVNQNNRRVPQGTPVIETAAMQYTVTVDSNNQWSIPPAFPGPLGDRTDGVNVLLRRLANPHLPPNPDPLNPFFNPYVTVDYLRGMPAEQTTPFGSGGTNRQSRGKDQPYVSNAGGPQNLPQWYLTLIGTNPPYRPETTHNFGSLNEPRALRAEWLTHLDRQLISPMELLHVSGVTPHLLTQRFSPPTFGHRVPWFEQKNRLFRIFEWIETKDRGEGISPLGRQPGKVNINMIFDPEVLSALADAYDGPPPSQSFSQADVDALFLKLLRVRHSILGPPPAGPPAPGPFDRPFLGLAGLQAPSPTDPQGHPVFGRGINDTLLRSEEPGDGETLGGVNTKRLFEPVGTLQHPYQQYELMTKIHNHLTTRSNVFAVWLTVGFFQVTDDTTVPVKLGEEIGAAQNRQVRYRMFSIVDRTRLHLDLVLRRSANNASGAVTQTDTPVEVQIAVPNPIQPPDTGPLSGVTPGGVPWDLTDPGNPQHVRPGTILVVDEGPNEETVIVEPPNPARPFPPGTYGLTATFRKLHGPNFRITIPGNPGPQLTFSVRTPAAREVVPFFTMLD